MRLLLARRLPQVVAVLESGGEKSTQQIRQPSEATSIDRH